MVGSLIYMTRSKSQRRSNVCLLIRCDVCSTCRVVQLQCLYKFQLPVKYAWQLMTAVSTKDWRVQLCRAAEEQLDASAVCMPTWDACNYSSRKASG